MVIGDVIDYLKIRYVQYTVHSRYKVLLWTSGQTFFSCVSAHGGDNGWGGSDFLKCKTINQNETLLIKYKLAIKDKRTENILRKSKGTVFKHL